jgi:diguanylate cyclase (GGDEF)-like protein
MKKIIYILNDGKRAFTYERIAGFCEAIKKADEEINFYIFRSSGYAGYDAAHNCGEYNIYRLPNLEDFDGIFLDISNVGVTNENMYGARGASYIIRAAAASGKPVIAIANRIADFYYVGINNSSAMTSVISYLHEDLGLSDFWFIMGPADNYENIIRTEALKKYCKEHRLPSEKLRFYAESFTTECGINGFERIFHQHGGRLPHAVICANDWIATGVCKAAASHGIKVPGDLYITGFDNTDSSSYHSPGITTVDQYRWDMGKTCLDLMERIWRGEKVDNITYTETRIVKRESTGDLRISEADLEARMAESINKEVYTATINDKICTLQYRLPGCSSLEEICEALAPCIAEIKCKGFWIAIDKELYDYGSQIEIDQESGSIKASNSRLKTDGYPDTLEIVYRWDKKRGGQCTHEIIHGLFPYFDGRQAGNDYMFIPLHFMDTTVGFVAINDCLEIMHSANIAPIVNTLTMALRSFFSGKKLEYVNQMLSGISMSDNLTGLCNRLGYHHLASRLFKKTHDAGESLGILFIDMDKMKWFNDTFGHACGDDAIRCLSTTIRNCITGEAIPVRFGGDEFLVITPIENKEEIENLITMINETLPKESEKYSLPDVPGISTGYVITDPSSPITLNEYVEEADKLMYNEKKAKKAGRG